MPENSDGRLGTAGSPTPNEGSTPNVYLAILDELTNPMGVFTAMRGDGGQISDFRIDYINQRGAAVNGKPRDQQLGQRLFEQFPFLREMGLFDAFVEMLSTGQPLMHEFASSDSGGPTYYEVQARSTGDRIVAQWHETTARHKSDTRARENASRLRSSNETLENRVRQRTAEADARAEQLRDLALDLAESESRERKRFAQLLHDHFQQLVSAAKMRAGIIRRKAESPELRSAIAQVEQLLVQAIDASRSLASQLSPPVLHDAGLVPAVESIVRSTEREHGIAIRFHGDAGAEPANERIRLVLFEAVRELLENVVQHSGGKSATVSLKAISTAPTAIQIVVADDGCGFDPLVRLPKQEDKPFGLLRTQERLRYIGGTMAIESQVGQGAVIRISVPAELRRVDTPAGPIDVASLAPPVVTTGPLPTSHVLRIVVADDHRLFREGLINLLGHESYLQVVGEASDGQEAMQLVRSLRPDVLICDISMPNHNGVEVTATLSRELPDVKIIGLSMHEREDMANAMRAAGAVAYLTKSGPSDLLLGILRTFLPAATTAK